MKKRKENYYKLDGVDYCRIFSDINYLLNLPVIFREKKIDSLDIFL